MTGALLLERFDRGGARPELPLRAARLAAAGWDEPAATTANDQAAAEDGAAEPSAGADDPHAPFFAELIRSVEAQIPALRAYAVATLAEEFGRALMAALPSLVDERTRDEIARAACAMVDAGAHDRATLALSPGDHDGVVDRLKALAPPLWIEVVRDPALGHGTARLAWPGGGAEIDVGRLLDAAREVLARRIGALSQRIDENEQGPG